MNRICWRDNKKFRGEKKQTLEQDFLWKKYLFILERVKISTYEILVNFNSIACKVVNLYRNLQMMVMTSRTILDNRFRQEQKG